MSEITTITKEDFDRAIESMASENDLVGLMAVYSNSPEHLKEQVLQSTLGMLRKITSRINEVDDFCDYITDELEDGPEYVDDYSKDSDLPKELFVEFAIISAADGVSYVHTFLEREDLTLEDKKKIMNAAVLGAGKSAEQGWADSIVQLLEYEPMTEEQHKAICNEIVRALKIEPAETSAYDVAGTVLLHPKAPIEVKKAALEACAENGGFVDVMKAMEMEDANLVFDGKAEQWLSVSVVSVENYCEEEKILMIVEASKNEECLPNTVRELLPRALRNAMEKLCSRNAPRNPEEYLKRMLAEEGISQSVKETIEAFISEPEGPIATKKAEKTEEKVELSYDIALAYLKQIRDMDKSGLMTAPKNNASEKEKKKPKIKA